MQHTSFPPFPAAVAAEGIPCAAAAAAADAGDEDDDEGEAPIMKE